MASLFLIPLIFASSAQAKDELSNDDIRAGKTFPFKSAKVVYKKTGMTTGTETLWIADYGRTQVRESKLTTKAFGFSNTDESVVITTEDTITSINLKTNTATTMANPAKGFRESMKNKSDAEIEQFKKQMMGMSAQLTGEQEYKPIGTEKILGKKCEIYSMSMMGGTSKVWTWANLPLKTETAMMGNNLLDEAVELEVGVKIPKSKLKVPAGVTVQEMPQMGNLPFNMGQQR